MRVYRLPNKCFRSPMWDENTKLNEWFVDWTNGDVVDS